MRITFGRYTPALAAMVSIAMAACSAAAPAAAPTSSAAGQTGAAAKPTSPPAAAQSAATVSTSGAPVELVFVPHVTPNLTVDFWNTEIARFQAANPDIKVTISAGPDTQTSKYVQTLVASNSTPDVSTLIVSEPAFWPLLQPFDQNDPDIQQISDASKAYVGGKLLNLGIAKEARNTIFYNKNMFAKAGIAALPKTYAEFEAACDKLKAAGFTPMITAGGSGASWVAGDALNILSDTLKNNDHWYTDYKAGKVKFTDPDWIEGATRVESYANKGYFVNGALGITYAQAEQAFLAGQGAMYLMGTWFSAAAAKSPPSFEIGVMVAPTKDGKQVLNGAVAWGGYSIFKSTKHPAESLRLAKYLAFNADELKGFLDADGQFTGVKLTSGALKRDFTPLQQQIQQLMDTLPFNPSQVGQGDNTPRAGVIEPVFNQVGQAMLQGKGDPKTELAKVDAAWLVAPGE
jgi:ABC-type glycerol-3-phosphate transport system substrate-binding protein